MARFTRLRLEHWKNFAEVDVALQQRVFIVGPNGSGKSNLLDALRFLGDVASDEGGLQRAVRSRGGLAAIRARSGDPAAEIVIAVDVDVTQEDAWRYHLVLGERSDGPFVARERVWHADRLTLDREPGKSGEDAASARQTHLEQAVANARFRALADALGSVRYVHLVPQLFRDPARPRLEADEPYDRALLDRVAAAPAARRAELVATAERALRSVVPQLRSLRFEEDERGRPHLVTAFAHWRSTTSPPDEHAFSDGMIRMLGMVWALLEGDGPLLLEEPEQSLHQRILCYVPGLIWSASRGSGRQVILTTHASELFVDEGIGLAEIVLLSPGPDGTKAQPLAEIPDLVTQYEAGIPLAEIVLAAAAPAEPSRLLEILFTG